MLIGFERSGKGAFRRGNQFCGGLLLTKRSLEISAGLPDLPNNRIARMGHFIFGAAQFRLSYAKFFAPGETVEERQLDRESGAIDRFVASEVGRVPGADIQFRPSRISV